MTRDRFHTILTPTSSNSYLFGGDSIYGNFECQMGRRFISGIANIFHKSLKLHKSCKTISDDQKGKVFLII